MNTVTKNIYTVVFIDPDTNVADKDSVVASYDRVSRKDETAVLEDILVNSDLAEKLKEHNAKRAEMIRETASGTEVKLKPIEIGDLVKLIK